MRTVQLLCFFAAFNLFASEPFPFVNVGKFIPEMTVQMRYYTTENFVGTRVDGYAVPICYLTPPAADALRDAEASLKPFGLGLKLFDCYRPQRAVDHFVRWAEDLNDTKTKRDYYPNVPKSKLFARGYIAARSGHSRGSTVDLTLIDLKSGTELDMGTPFDFFSPRSWPTSPEVTAQQRANRLLLRRVMTGAGFRPLKEEWWHFTLENEPYPDTYFDLPIR